MALPCDCEKCRAKRRGTHRSRIIPGPVTADKRLVQFEEQGAGGIICANAPEPVMAILMDKDAPQDLRTLVVGLLMCIDLMRFAGKVQSINCVLPTAVGAAAQQILEEYPLPHHHPDLREFLTDIINNARIWHAEALKTMREGTHITTTGIKEASDTLELMRLNFPTASGKVPEAN